MPPLSGTGSNRSGSTRDYLGRSAGSHQGLDILLRALAHRTEVLWVAAGDGEERETLQAMARELGVSVHLPGNISAEQREALLSESDLFIQPSVSLNQRQEGTPVAVLEALSAGVPVIASATGGMIALAESAGVHLVPAADHVALQKAIMMLLSDSKRRQRMSVSHRQFGREVSWARLGPQHRLYKAWRAQVRTADPGITNPWVRRASRFAHRRSLLMPGTRCT